MPTLFIVEGKDDATFLRYLLQTHAKGASVQHKTRDKAQPKYLNSSVFHITNGICNLPVLPQGKTTPPLLSKEQQDALLQVYRCIASERTPVEVRWLLDSDNQSHESRQGALERLMTHLNQRLAQEAPSVPPMGFTSQSLYCLTPYLEAYYVQALKPGFQQSLASLVDAYLSGLGTLYSQEGWELKNIHKKQLQLYLMSLPLPFNQCKLSNPKAIEWMIDASHPCFSGVLAWLHVGSSNSITQ